MAARHYNLDEVMLIVCGVPVTEYVEGDAISLERTNPRFTIKDGHHGSSMYSKNPANSGTATVKCMQGSPVNALLQTIADTDNLSGLGTGPFEVKDLNGDSVAYGETSRLEGDPPMGFATEAGEVEWKVLVAGLTISHGQNRLA